MRKGKRMAETGGIGCVVMIVMVCAFVFWI
jgi:hypothetical protein